MASNLIFVITNAGIAAAASASTGGYKIKVATWAVGSAVNYTPLATDTGLHGTQLDSGSISSVNIDTNNQVTFVARLDQTRGNYSFGEIGLYLDTGTLFALGSLQSVQEKVQATTNNPGNVITMGCTVVLTNLGTTVQIILDNNTAQKIPVITNPVLLSPTPTDPNQPNTELISQGDDAGNAILATYNTATGLWSFDTHMVTVYANIPVSSMGSGNTVVNATMPALSNLSAGTYLLQATSGASKAQVRYVTVSNTNSITVDNAITMAAADTFSIYQSTSSLLSQVQPVLNSFAGTWFAGSKPRTMFYGQN